MRARRLRAALALAALVAFLLTWTILIRRFGPEGIVERIGVRNGYLLVFLIASAGGLSTFTSVALYTSVATLAAGGLHVSLLGMFAGIGLTIGDSLFFLIGMQGRRASSGRLRDRLERLSAWFRERPEWALRLAIFLYAGLTPMPNDLMVMTLAASGIRYRMILPSLLAGNLVLATLTAVIGGGFSWSWFR